MRVRMRVTGYRMVTDGNFIEAPRHVCMISCSCTEALSLPFLLHFKVQKTREFIKRLTHTQSRRGGARVA